MVWTGRRQVLGSSLGYSDHTFVSFQIRAVQDPLIDFYTLFTNHEGPQGEKGYSPTLFLDLGTRRGEGSASGPGRFTPGKDPVPIVQESGWAPGSVWTGSENLATAGIRSPDRPSRSQSLY
jgi:hypothetical protein